MEIALPNTITNTLFASLFSHMFVEKQHVCLVPMQTYDTLFMSTPTTTNEPKKVFVTQLLYQNIRIFGQWMTKNTEIEFDKENNLVKWEQEDFQFLGFFIPNHHVHRFKLLYQCAQQQTQFDSNNETVTITQHDLNIDFWSKENDELCHNIFLKDNDDSYEILIIPYMDSVCESKYVYQMMKFLYYYDFCLVRDQSSSFDVDEFLSHLRFQIFEIRQFLRTVQYLKSDMFEFLCLNAFASWYINHPCGVVLHLILNILHIVDNNDCDDPSNPHHQHFSTDTLNVHARNLEMSVELVTAYTNICHEIFGKNNVIINDFVNMLNNNRWPDLNSFANSVNICLPQDFFIWFLLSKKSYNNNSDVMKTSKTLVDDYILPHNIRLFYSLLYQHFDHYSNDNCIITKFFSEKSMEIESLCLITPPFRHPKIGAFSSDNEFRMKHFRSNVRERGTEHFNIPYLVPKTYDNLTRCLVAKNSDRNLPLPFRGTHLRNTLEIVHGVTNNYPIIHFRLHHISARSAIPMLQEKATTNGKRKERKDDTINSNDNTNRMMMKTDIDFIRCTDAERTCITIYFYLITIARTYYPSLIIFPTKHYQSIFHRMLCSLGYDESGFPTYKFMQWFGFDAESKQTNLVKEYFNLYSLNNQKHVQDVLSRKIDFNRSKWLYTLVPSNKGFQTNMALTKGGPLMESIRSVFIVEPNLMVQKYATLNGRETSSCRWHCNVDVFDMIIRLVPEKARMFFITCDAPEPIQIIASHEQKENIVVDHNRSNVDDDSQLSLQVLVEAKHYNSMQQVPHQYDVDDNDDHQQQQFEYVYELMNEKRWLLKMNGVKRLTFNYQQQQQNE